MNQTFRANGKLLLTGEYFVLDGVGGLAVPTKKGQSLTITDGSGSSLLWTALLEDGSEWFAVRISKSDWARPQVPVEGFKARICQLLAVAESLRTGCTDVLAGRQITTRLEFDRHWGLGSSSTLVSCLARLLEVDPYALLAGSFGGSGYDLACAVSDTPILYTRTGPIIVPVSWMGGEWTDNAVFVYRNQKQNSREGIRRYREQTVSEATKKEIAGLTFALSSPALDLRAAAQILKEHEEIVSKTIGLPTVQEELFPDFPGQLKSLGAWGGDFVMALSEEGPEKMRTYFNERGYQTVIPYNEMVLGK